MIGLKERHGPMMTAGETNIHVLDAAYKPFPPFTEWQSRTTLDNVRWERYNTSLKSTPGLSSERLRWASHIATRAAALDTGAIEGLYEVDRGFTYTVAFETSAWEVALAQKGENVRPLFEAQLHAYDYVLDLATKAEPISEAAIRVLHEVVCQAQPTYRVMTAIGPQEQPLPKGRYKSLPNHVRTRDGIDHSYAPVDVTPGEMARLVAEIRSDAFLAAHPVAQAAYAHYALVVIHPFADGNGRVARALASAFTYRAISMPIVILSEHKDVYLDALEAADSGEFQTFVDFMLAKSLDTIRLVDESVLKAISPSPEESATAISALYLTSGGYTQELVDAGGTSLLQALQTELTKAMPQNLTGRVRDALAIVDAEPDPAGNLVIKDHSHRLTSDQKMLRFALISSHPARAFVERKYTSWVPIDAGGDDEIQLRRKDGSEMFLARMEEVLPALSGILQIRLNMFAERVVGEMLSELKVLAEISLK